MNNSNIINNSIDIGFIHILSLQMLEGYYLWICPDYSITKQGMMAGFFSPQVAGPLRSTLYLEPPDDEDT